MFLNSPDLAFMAESNEELLLNCNYPMLANVRTTLTKLADLPDEAITLRKNLQMRCALMMSQTSR